MQAGRERPLVVAIATTPKPDNTCSLAMVATPETNEFEFLGHRFGETKGRLDRLGAAREQLYVGDAFGQHAADQFEETGASVGCEATEGDAVELFPEALDLTGMAGAKAADGNAG